MFYGVIVDPSKKDPVAYVPSPDGDMLLYVHVPVFPLPARPRPLLPPRSPGLPAFRQPHFHLLP